MYTRIIIVASSLLFATGALAAKPVKITPGAKQVSAAGEPYRQYVVTCSNGRQQALTAWDKGRKWCFQEDLCTKKQIKAAKKACKSAS